MDPNTFIDDTTEDEQRIKLFQQWLIDLLWLDEEKPSGEFDKTTKAAVEAFQLHLVNLRDQWEKDYKNADEFILELKNVNGSYVEERMLKLFASMEFGMKPELVNPNPPVQ